MQGLGYTPILPFYSFVILISPGNFTLGSTVATHLSISLFGEGQSLRLLEKNGIEKPGR